jgi:NADH dehydrogenase FAD-containing subunit
VCGAGFTGIELAAELPGRLGQDFKPRIILVDNAGEVGPELGLGPRPVITQALKDLGVETKLGSGVAEVGAKGVTLCSGEYIETMTAVWTAGVRATPLTEQIPGAKDSLSRLHVDQDLRVPSSKHVFATGDAARALTDTKGHYAMMSCQHAHLLGRVSGYNAAADLLGEPKLPYSQTGYGTCLDLGAWGSVITRGWEREVKLTGDAAKRIKTSINQELIYPPSEAEEAIAVADPVTYPGGEELFDQLLAPIM